MILIADSGSTKTEWVLLDHGSVTREIRTQGVNPFFQDEAAIEKVIMDELLPGLDALMRDAAFSICYYGAGCSAPSRCEMVQRPLQKAFPNARIDVHHDLMAAARALCGKEKGIAAILGTGSNSCLFDGKDIIANTPSLGFIMGDEGSGGHIGKELLKMFVYNELGTKLKQGLIDTYQLDKEKILNTVYYQPMPNRYCASFMPFVAEHKHDPQIQEMVSASFHEFFKRHIIKYEGHQSLPFSCIGSVALIFREQLNKAAGRFGIHVHKVIKDPMEGLISYHAETSA